MSDLQDFIKANKGKITDFTTVVSHPERGFSLIQKPQLQTFLAYGWTEESQIELGELKGVKKTGGRGRKRKVEAESEE